MTKRIVPRLRSALRLLYISISAFAILSAIEADPYICSANAENTDPIGPTEAQETEILKIITEGPRGELSDTERKIIEKQADDGDPVAITRLCYHHIARGEGEECSKRDRHEAYSNRLTYASLYGANLFKCAKNERETFEGLFWLLYGAQARAESDEMSRLLLAKAFRFGIYGVPRIPELAEFLLKYRRGGRRVPDAIVKSMIAKIDSAGSSAPPGECGKNNPFQR